MFWGKIKRETKGTTSSSGGATRGTTSSRGGATRGTSPACRDRIRSVEILKSQKERDLCRVRGEGGISLGFRKDILTENLSKRDNVLLVCKRCQGIIREACLSSTGEQFCSCCTKGEEQTHPNIYVRDTVLSLKCSCPLFQRGCEWLGTLGECENHLDVCSHVHEKCKLGCDIVLPRHELSIHVSEQCLFREIPCEHCQTDFKVCDMPDHIEKCPKMPLKCELKCGRVVCRMDMPHHLEKDCGRVVEKCKLGCGIKLRRDELDIHVNEKCVQRMIPCEYCHIDFKVCKMTIHLVECPKMPLKCELGCGTVVWRNNMAQHIDEECVEKMIECPFRQYKCEVGLIKKKGLNQHLEEKRTEHTELKLSAMEEIVMQQNERINNQNETIEQMSQEMESLKTEAKLNKSEILKQILPKITNLYWKIKMEDILCLSRDRYSFFPTHVLEQFQAGRYVFILLLEYTRGDYFVIKFYPMDGFDFDKLTQPSKAVFITSLICHDNSKYIKKLGAKLIEDQEQRHISTLNTIATFRYSDITKEFIKDECIDFEIFVNIFKT